MFEGYSGGIRVVFEGIQMVFRVFGLSGMCKTIQAWHLRKSRIRPSSPFIILKGETMIFGRHFQMGCDIGDICYDLLEFYLPWSFRILPIMVS